MKFSEAINLYEETTNLNVDPVLKFGRPVERITINQRDFDLRQFAVFLGDPDIEQIAQRDIVQMVRLMLKLGWKINAISPKLISLRKFFTHYRRHNLNILDPLLVPKLKRDFSTPHVADPEHLTKLITHIQSKIAEPLARPKDKAGRWREVRNLALLLALRDTGARVSEILSLNTDQLKLDVPLPSNPNLPSEEIWGTIIKTEKTRGVVPFRQIFWKRETNEMLKLWLEKRAILIERYKNDIKDTKAVFIGVSRYLHGTRLINSSVALILRKYCRELKIPTINPHSLRHLFGHDIVKNYGSGADVMNLLGHATLASSTTYTRMFGKELEGRYRALRTNHQNCNGNGYPPTNGVPELHPFGSLKPREHLIPFKFNHDYEPEPQNS